MEAESTTIKDKFELRPIIGLTHGLSMSDIESLTVDAIRTHRALVSKAEQMFQALPEEYRLGKAAGGAQHLAYIEAAIEMHAQMSVVNTLLDILGYVPKLSVN